MNSIIKNKPLVSVIMITYAHEHTIIKAIEGILMQKCNFEVELIIANDASPDATHERIEDFLRQNKIPENISIRYTKHDTNIGMMFNVIWAFNQAKGKYVAVCEGDDYWITEDKLQRQADFLEANADYGLVHTNYKKYYAKTSKFEKHIPYANISRSDENNYFLRTGDIRTCTVLFRTSFLPKFKILMMQDFMKDTVIGDRPFFLLISKYSKIHFINEVTSVYYITAFNSASNFTDIFRYYEFLKKVSVVNIKLLEYLKIDNPEYIQNQQRKISFYDVLLSFKQEKTVSFFKKLIVKSGKHLWNKDELKELYGIIKNK